MAKQNNILQRDIQCLREHLTEAFRIAEKLGIDVGGEKMMLTEKLNQTANPKPEGKRAKVDKYMMALTTGKRLTKAEILKN